MLIQQLQGIPPSTPSASAERAAIPAASGESAMVGTRPLVDTQAAARAAPTSEELAKAVGQANQTMSALSASLSFEVDADTHQTVVKVIDTSDNRILRQIPSQEMLDIARALDKLQGLLVREQA